MTDLNLARLRRWAMQEALNRSPNIKEAADLLGIDRSALSRDSRVYGLTRPWEDGKQRNPFRDTRLIDDSPERTPPERWKMRMLEHFKNLHERADLLQARLDDANAIIAKMQAERFQKEAG